MAYPVDVLATGDLVTAAQINRWCVMLADETLASADADFDFTSIPAHWTHLLVMLYLRGTAVTTQVGVAVRFNNDSAGNYDHVRHVINSGGVSTTGARAQTSAAVGYMAGSSSTADSYDAMQLWVPHYAGTADRKALQASGAHKQDETTDASLNMVYGGGWWRSAAAIDQVTVIPSSGNFEAGSRATLYGMGRI